MSDASARAALGQLALALDRCRPHMARLALVDDDAAEAWRDAMDYSAAAVAIAIQSGITPNVSFFATINASTCGASDGDTRLGADGSRRFTCCNLPAGHAGPHRFWGLK